MHATGMEIRTQVTQYVSDKIRALRVSPGSIDPDNPNELNQFTPRSAESIKAATASNSIVAVVVTKEVEGPPAKKQKTGKEQKKVEEEAEPEEGVQVWEGINKDLLPPETYAYGNVGVLRGNAMKFLPNFFEKGQVSLHHYLTSLVSLSYLAGATSSSPMLRFVDCSCRRSFSFSRILTSKLVNIKHESSRQWHITRNVPTS